MKAMKQYHLIYKLGRKWVKIQSAPYPVLVNLRNNLLKSGTYNRSHALTITHGDINNLVWSANGGRLK